jgi:hypothetical protein
MAAPEFQAMNWQCGIIKCDIDRKSYLFAFPAKRGPDVERIYFSRSRARAGISTLSDRALTVEIPDMACGRSRNAESGSMEWGHGMPIRRKIRADLPTLEMTAIFLPCRLQTSAVRGLARFDAARPNSLEPLCRWCGTSASVVASLGGWNWRECGLCGAVQRAYTGDHESFECHFQDAVLVWGRGRR